MRRPESLWDQYHGKALAELYRGCGYCNQPHPVELEPPWTPFERRNITAWDCWFNDWEGPWDPAWFRWSEGEPLHRLGEPLLLPSSSRGAEAEEVDTLAPVVVERFPEDEPTIPKAQQFLLALPVLRRPVAFEVLGLGAQPEYGLPNSAEVMEARRENRRPVCWTEPSITVQFVTDRSDARRVQSLMRAHYPNSAAVIHDELRFATDLLPGHDLLHGHGEAASLALNTGYPWPLKVYPHLTIDPLTVVAAAMENLKPFEWALVQVVFQRAEYPWADNLREAVSDPYKPDKLLFNDLPQRTLTAKLATPLFAVAIRIGALRREVFRRLLGWAEQFTAPPQHLQVCQNDEPGDLAWSTMARVTFRPGMLLNIEELSGLVHLPGPAVQSERLRRVQTRTRAAPATKAEAGSVVLGRNVHQGQVMVARIPAALRPRHCYIAGSSGTGKSTLLLNMALHDIAAGHGVGVLDPHGDLIKAILRRMPAHRVNDVILFDPADSEYPFALNILDAKDETERERIVSETVMALERYFPSSWGPRLERILTYTIYSVLDALPHPTLADVERMLTDAAFRAEVAGKIKTQRFRAFWDNEFRWLPKNAADPVLNKLSVFLTHRLVRNITCQRRSAVDFDQVLNGGKIFLANLSSGQLTEQIAGVLGSFITTKIVNAAFRRAVLPEERRRPWYLYIDEFQAFMNLSVGFERILAEARKYRLVLAGLANQYVGQLSPPVRQAIFGNVGVLVAFRVGVDDAHLVAKELGNQFTAEEIMSLGVGQALVRAGGARVAYNVQTELAPEPLANDPTECIVQQTRQQFCTPRHLVERALNHGCAGSQEAEEKSHQNNDLVH